MVEAASTLTKYSYPTWIETNECFKQVPNIRKVFPKIGLANFEEEFKIDNTDAIESAVRAVIYTIQAHLNATMNDFRYLKIAETTEVKNFINTLKNFNTILTKNSAALFIRKNSKGTCTLHIPQDIIDGRGEVVFPAGSKLFKVFESCKKECCNKYPQVYFVDIIKANSIVHFNSINIPENTKLVLSSDGDEGIWDIATMSMRGVKSCQTWNPDEPNSKRVIGSMIDPFTSVIYLTNGSSCNGFGRKMIRRCVLRYAWNRIKDRPILLMEKMYPSYDQNMINAFKQAIQKRVKDIDVLSFDIGQDRQTIVDEIRVCLSKELSSIANSYHPYVDSKIPWEKVATPFFEPEPEIKEIKSDEPSFTQKQIILSSAWQKAIKSMMFTKSQMEKWSLKDQNLMLSLRGKSKQSETTQDSDKLISISRKFIAALPIDNISKTTLESHKEKSDQFLASQLQFTKKFSQFASVAIINHMKKNLPSGI